MKPMFDFKMANLLFVGFLFSCSPDPFSDCFNSSGPEVTITQPLPSHPGVLELKDNVDVVWHRSDSSYLVLTCGRNLASKVTTDLKDGILTIRNRNRCNWVRDYKREMQVDIYCKEPHAFYFKGYGDFRTADTLQAQEMEIHQFGAGKSEMLLHSHHLAVEFNCVGHMELKGRVQTANYFMLDVGKFDATSLSASTVDLKMEGDNDVWIQAQDSLKGTVLTGRTIFYKGKPNVAVSTPMGGKLVCLDR